MTGRILWTSAAVSLFCAAPAFAAEDARDAPPSEADASVEDEQEEEIAELRHLLQAVTPGEHRFLVGGYAFGGFRAGSGGERALFAGFSPVLLWKLSDRLFAEGELEFTLAGPQPEIGVEFVQLSYLVNDRLALSAGKLLTSFGLFVERFHPKWINKLPDNPLGLGSDRMVPEEMLGAQARGSVDLGSTRLIYTAYAGSGPRMRYGDGPGGAASAGTLDFDQLTDAANWSVGAFVGILPDPSLELDYSILWARVGAPGTPSAGATALLHALAFSYQRDSPILHGRIELRAEWMFSAVDTVTFDPDSALGLGPTAFTNRRSAGYAQLSYRPSHAANDFLRSLELVGRYGFYTRPRGAPANAASTQTAIGIDCWLASSAVLKLAYELGSDDLRNGQGSTTHSFLAQLAMGF